MKLPLSALLLSLLSLVASAKGNWTVHPVYSAPVSRVLETSTDVFLLAGGSLFGYDKESDERRSYTSDNYLSSAADIADIFYDAAADRVMLAYTDGNIDILYGKPEPERVVNIPDIAASSIVGSHAVRDVAFDGDTAFVATDFGLVKLDLAKGETLASGRYPKAVTGVALTPGHIIVKYDNGFYSIPRGERIVSVDGFRRIGSWSDLTELHALSPNLLITNNRGTIYTLRVNDTATGVSSARELTGGAPVSKAFIHTPEGNVRFSAKGNLYEVTSDGTMTLLAQLVDDIASDAIGCLGDLGHIWGASREGLVCYGYDGAGNWTLRSDRYRPEALSVKRVAFITPGADDSRVYFSNLGPTVYRLGFTTGDEGLAVVQNATLLDLEDGTMTDVTAYPADAKYELTASNQLGYGRYPLAPTVMAEDPDDPGVYWLGTGNDGLYRIASGELDGRYDQDNAPFVPEWGCRVYSVTFDRGGNMWVASHTGGSSSGIAVLPAEKRRRHPSEVTAADWVKVDIPGYKSNKDVRVLHCRRSDMIFIVDANKGIQLVAIDTRGTFGDLSDDIVRVWDSLIDQDGKTFAPDRHSALVEDLGGRVWLGTSGGVIELPYPQQAATNSLTVTHVKVPRRDGTNSADYLLESDLVYDIAVDHADRKWLATEGSGVFLVSPRGDEIIENFTSANSPLPSNRVNAVYCSPRSNAVFFGTDRGVVEYASSASPAAEDYDDILVYPNPVRPEHSGPVTITGLKDGSLVKIANAAGRVLWQGRSEGGMCRWPVTDNGGRRVPSGVYFILASQSGPDIDSSGAVARVAVVN